MDIWQTQRRKRFQIQAKMQTKMLQHCGQVGMTSDRATIAWKECKKYPPKIISGTHIMNARLIAFYAADLDTLRWNASLVDIPILLP